MRHLYNSLLFQSCLPRTAGRHKSSDPRTPAATTAADRVSSLPDLPVSTPSGVHDTHTPLPPCPVGDHGDRFIARLSEMNEDPNALYRRDCQESELRRYERSLLAIGFKPNVDIKTLEYVGKDPASALKALINLDFLISDCRVSLNIIDYSLLLNNVGPSRFNEIIKNYCDGKLDFKLLPIRNEKIHYQYHESIQENTDLAHLTKGDIVYLFGNRIGFGFKPTSDTNGFNLVVIGKNDDNALLFKGFHSFGDAAHTYAEIISLFKTELAKPITYEDLATIMASGVADPTGRPYNCHLTHAQIYDSLRSDENMGELLKSASPDTNKKTESKIQVPARYLEDPCIGLAAVRSFNKEAYGELRRALPLRAGALLTKETIPSLRPPQSTGFIPTFTEVLPSQQALVGGVQDFFNECIHHESYTRPGGLVVYGPPGTGKTHCCEYVIDLLEKHGKTILRKGFHDQLLSKDDYIKCLRMPLDNKDADIDYVIKTLSGQWANIDIFYIDDVNVSVSEHSLVTRAILKYAKDHNIKVLINSNSSPFEVIHKDCDRFTGFFRALEIIGPDHRGETTWYSAKQLGEQLGRSTKMSTEREWTPDQIKIANWLELLDEKNDPKKSNGLFIIGQPGTGKTTVIKEALKDKQVQWVNNHTIKSFLLQDLQKSDEEFLVIEDINNIRFNNLYIKLLAQICNSDEIKNKTGNPIKIILTSNGNNDLIENLKKDPFLKDLGPRMNSRFNERFNVVSVDSTDDMRQQSPAYGAFLTKVPADLQKNDVFILNLNDFFNTLTQLSKANKFHDMCEYRASIVRQASRKGQIVIICDAHVSNYRFLTGEFFEFLDLMEDENKQLLIINKSVSAPDFKEELKELILQDFLEPLPNKVKYVSRINRLPVA
jgi:predicted ATPase